MIQTVPGYETATYVEGIAVLVAAGIRFPIGHGWVEKDGEIIDPTMPVETLVYFAGLRFIGLPGLAEALAIPKPDCTNENLPNFYRFGWGGAYNPEFAQARQQSHRLAFGTLLPQNGTSCEGG